jgi:hypothetical protein
MNRADDSDKKQGFLTRQVYISNSLPNLDSRCLLAYYFHASRALLAAHPGICVQRSLFAGGTIKLQSSGTYTSNSVSSIFRFPLRRIF